MKTPAIGLLLALAGCFPMQSPDDQTFDDIRAKCRAEARDVYYDGGTEGDALVAYHHCLARWGVL